MYKYMERHDCKKGELYVVGIVVGCNYQGLGIGKDLFKEAEQYCASNRYSFMSLAVVSSNPRAKALYEKIEYKTI